MAERGVIFKDDFVSVPSKSWFDMSYDNLLSMNFGEIVPTTCMECMAEDVIHAKSSNFTRLAPLVAPAFGKVNQFSYHFYVRNRDIWTHWDSFFTNADQKKSWQSSLSTTFVPPVMPYIDIRKIIYGEQGMFSKLGGNQQDIFLPNITTGSIPNTNNIDLSYGGYTMDCHMLVFWKDSNGQYSSVVEQPYIRNNSRQMIAFVYIPNKNEYDADASVVRATNVTTGRFYNPFSNGSLLDYLGVDLTGMYLEQLNYYSSIVTEFEKSTFLNNNIGFDPFTDDFTPSLFYNASTDYIKNSKPFSGKLSDFLQTHAVLGCFYFLGTSAGYCSCGQNNKWFMHKSSDSNGTFSGWSPLLRSEESAKVSSLPLRAYYFVYSEYFRDENYIDINPIIDFTRDGDEFQNNPAVWNQFDFLTLKRKSWEHDPYTTALPGAQRGQAVHFMPNGVDVNGIYSNTSLGAVTKRPLAIGVKANYNQGGYVASADTSIGASDMFYKLQADLSAATIENFRFANATQRYLEKVARSGNRYYEYMKSIFGADIEDAKLNRPIYLQGDKTPIQISEVLQTSASQLSDDQPLGQMAGRAVSVGNDDYLEYVTPDNGFFIELCCVLPRVCYQQGLAQMFTRKVQLDYPIPDYAQLGEEQVDTGNLFYSADDSLDSIPFGYQSRYWSWKYNRDVCHGEFKDSLDHWTWTRKFDTRPIAGKKFLEVDLDYRQFAVPSRNTEHVYTHMFHDIQVERALPIFGVPSL